MTITIISWSLLIIFIGMNIIEWIRDIRNKD